MKHIDIRRIFGAAVWAGSLTLAACSGAADPQGGPGNMMGGDHANGWMGGYGGPWMLLLVAAIAGLVVWLVARGKNQR